MKKLKNIAEVQIGYQATGRLVHEHHGTHRLIQLKDIVNDRVVMGDAITIVPKRDPARYLVLPGDVLFVARGRFNDAVLVADKLENTLAVSNFYIVRAKPAVLPEYLCWYLNQDEAQSYIKSRLHGSGIKMIKKSDLLELPLPVPPLEVQRMIADVARLERREAQLVEEIQEKRKELRAAVCHRAIHSKESN